MKMVSIFRASNVHDMRRTASTLLHELVILQTGLKSALAHEQKGVRAVYNKAEYARQRAYMLQQWADMIDSFGLSVYGSGFRSPVAVWSSGWRK